MSNLCHNCDVSHLPVPCAQPLQNCAICAGIGHTALFCPWGATNLNPNHKYFMLCHNCDQWHMPLPCSQELQQCTKCQMLGHLHVFCPLDATPRADLRTYFQKRNRVKLQAIRLDAAKQTLRLLQQYGGDVDAVLRKMAEPSVPVLDQGQKQTQ